MRVGIRCRVRIILLQKGGGEIDKLLLSAPTSVRLNVLISLAVAVLVKLESRQFCDLVALSKSTILIGINDGKTDLTSKDPGSLSEARLSQFAVVAPFCAEHDEPDLVATQNHVIIGLVIEADQVSITILFRNVGIWDILPAVALDAELFDVVTVALRDEILNNLLAVLKSKHLDQRRAVDSEVIAKLGAGRDINSTVVDLVVAAL